MLNLIKKLFSKKEELLEEKIELGQLEAWLEEKAKPIFEDLGNNINQIISKINDEKGKAFENIKKLENAQLQNPKIPERVKTIMQGNRAAFIKKTAFFFKDVDLKCNNDEGYDRLIEECNKIKDGIDLLGRGTARSYQVLNEFFAREAEKVASNIKNIENYSNEIKNSIKNSKMPIINKIKNNIANIQQKIKLKQKYSIELENNKNNLQNNKNKQLEIENKISEIKSSIDYKNYEKLLAEKGKIESEISEIENKLFHDFSILERALKKYSKIAFENEKLILNYSESPIMALMTDNDLIIIKILNDLKNNIVNDKLGLDAKKSGKILSKIKELDNNYFIDIQNNFKNSNEKVDNIKINIENNKAERELEFNNNELNRIRLNIENLNNNITNISSELGKISIEKLKDDLQEEVNDVTNSRIILDM